MLMASGLDGFSKREIHGGREVINGHEQAGGPAMFGEQAFGFSSMELQGHKLDFLELTRLNFLQVNTEGPLPTITLHTASEHGVSTISPQL